MLKNKKVVIFDMDGTLIDSIGIWNAIDEELIKTIGDGTIDNVDIAKQRDDTWSVITAGMSLSSIGVSGFSGPMALYSSKFTTGKLIVPASRRPV